MLRIRRRAAVATGEYLAVGTQALHHALGGCGNRSRQRIHALEFEMRTLGKVLDDATY